MPNELSALGHRYAVPIESIGIRLRFGVAGTKDAYFRAGTRESSCLGIGCVVRRHAFDTIPSSTAAVRQLALCSLGDRPSPGTTM